MGPRLAPPEVTHPRTRPVAVALGETRQIASATAGDFRVTFTASREPDDGSGEPPAATVDVEGSVRAKGAWVSVGTLPVKGTWFWFAVTDVGGVCQVSVGDFPRPYAVIGLSHGQSLGCAPTTSYHVENGRLVVG